MISVAYLQIGLDFTSKTSTVLYIVVSAISANKTCYMMMFLPLRGPPSFGWADHSNHHLFHCSHICTMTLNAQLLLCIPTCPCPASQQLGGQSLTTLTKFCPLLTAYLPPVEICDCYWDNNFQYHLLRLVNIVYGSPPYIEKPLQSCS